MLVLNSATIIGHADAGAVNLVGARIDGQISCDEASLSNDSGSALDADGLQVGQSMYLGVI
jgi:hypothetical protein